MKKAKVFLLLLSITLILALVGCGSSNNNTQSLSAILQNNSSAMYEAVENHDRASAKALYSTNYQSYYADQNTDTQSLWDELNIGNTMDYNELIALIDATFDSVADLTLSHSNVTFELISSSETTALTRYAYKITMSDGKTEVSTTSSGKISWAKEGSAWKITSEQEN